MTEPNAAPPPPPGWQPPSNEPTPGGGWQSTPGQPGAGQQGGWQSAPNQPTPPPSGAGGGAGTPSWMAGITSQAAVPGPAGYYYGDVPNRIIAYIVDAIIVGIAIFVVQAILGSVLPVVNLDFRSPNLGQFNVINLIIHALVGMVIAAAYFAYTWVNMRATPGMRLLGMQIGNATDGSSISYNQAILRWAILNAPIVIGQVLWVWPGLGIIFLLLLSIVWPIVLLVTTAQSPTKQGLHDQYARTVVVKAGRAVA